MLRLLRFRAKPREATEEGAERECATPPDYKAVLRDRLGEHVGFTHIDRSPRQDLGRVFVLIGGISIDQLRVELEAETGIKPNIGNAYAIQSVMYVLPYTPSAERLKTLTPILREDILTPGMLTAAVFIRGATNPIVASTAKNTAGNLLCGALEKLRERHGVKISWTFGEARAVLNTDEVLGQYDEELYRMEF